MPFGYCNLRWLLWSTIFEKITYFNEPHEFHYVLYKGMPRLVSHLGKVIVDDLGAGRCRLRWEVDFEFKTFHPFALIAPSFVKQFESVLQAALLSVKDLTEEAG